MSDNADKPKSSDMHARLSEISSWFIHYCDPRSSIICLNVSVFLGAWFVSKLCYLIGLPLVRDIYWTAVVGISAFITSKFLLNRNSRFNTLCHLEVELNYAMGSLSDMIISLSGMIETQSPMLLPRDKLQLSDDLVKGVGRLDLKNKLMIILCDFRKISHDWDIIAGFCKEHAPIIKDSSHPDSSGLKLSALILLRPLYKQSLKSISLLKESLLLVRYYMGKDKPLLRFKQPFVKPGEREREIEKDRKNLEKEILEINKASRRNIDGDQKCK